MRALSFNARLLLSSAMLAISLDTAAQAQSTAPPSASPQVNSDEIIVTANKREERVRDVAMSITAISGGELIRRQSLDTEDLSQRVAGLNFQQGGSIAGSGQRIILRGLNTGGNGSTVASVFDDAPLTFSGPVGGDRAVDLEPYDLARVEVLRGPQGSLYGANAMGGLIKYVSNAPVLNTFHVGFDVGGLTLAHAGNFGGSGRAFVNAPIVDDKIAVRASGFYDDSPGWIDDQLAHKRHVNGFRRYGGRATLLAEPTDRLTVRLTATYQKIRSDGVNAVEVGGALSPSQAFTPINGLNLNTYLDQPSSKETVVGIGNISYNIGVATLQSITSYSDTKNRITNDVPIYGYAFGGLIFGRQGTTLFYDTDIRLKKLTQEIRLASNNGAATTGHGLQWQLGGFYTNEDVDQAGNYFTRDTTTGANVTTPFSPTTAQALQSSQVQNYKEYAGYADATFYLSPRFDIEAGGRVFHNKQSATSFSGGAFVGTPLGTLVGGQTSSETSATFAVAPRFHLTPETLLYARVASGYRPGGPQNVIPNPPPGLPNQFKADKTINCEAGIKGSFLNGKLTADVAGFYIDWRDIQVNVIFPLGSVAYSIVANAGKAVSEGAEWNFTLAPTKGLSLAAIGAYTDAHLSQDAPGIGAHAGDQLPYVPKLGVTFTADYEWALSDNTRAYIGGSYSYTADRFNNYALTSSISHLNFPSYWTYAAQAGFNHGPFGFQLYGKNLGDKRGITSYYGGQAILGTTIPGQIALIRPREIGFRITGNF